jgi:hypothetical protein
MGGIGSGERLTKKDTVEDCLTIRMKCLRQKRLLQNRKSAVLRWTDVDGFESRIEIEVFLQEPRPEVRLRYNKTDSAGERHRLDYRVALCSIPCRFGGEQWYFLCPDCRRRFRQIHLPPEGVLFACRQCHDLTYESVQTHNQRWSELLRACSDERGETDWDAVRRLADRSPMDFFNMMAYRERRGG